MDIPTLEECQRIKALNFDLIDLLNKYKGSMCSDYGNRILDLLDGVQAQSQALEQKAFDTHRAYVASKKAGK